MYNNPYINTYNQQMSIDKLNEQINNLEKMRNQLQQPMQPTNLTQNFQLAPTNRDVIRYATSFEEVERDMVVGDTPYFSKDMAVVWIKNTKGDIKTYELTEIVPKDEKDIKIEFLEAQIKELKEGMKEYARSNDDVINESIESKKPTNVSNGGESKTKQKKPYGDIQTSNKQ